MSEYIFVYVTFKNREEAKEVASYLIKRRLTACANIFSSHESLYWWDGAVQDEQEVSVILKTSKKCFKDLEEAIKEKHSYDVPCIVALPIEGGNNAFLSWIKNQTNTAA